MKRLFFAAVCAAALLATSCEKSFDGAEVSGEKTVSLSVNIGLPEISTRVFADGTTATELQYAVYEVTEQGLSKIDGDEYEGTETIRLSTKLSFTLLKDHKYGLVFWAAAPSKDGWTNPYKATFAADGAEVTFDADVVETLEANDDRNDAFYAYQEVEVTGDSAVSVQLYRPFAQINIGTNDYDKAAELGIDTESLVSYVEVPVSGSLNLVTGELDAEKAVGKVKFGGKGVPTTESYPVKGYKYLAMAYVLVGAEQETVDVTFGYSNDSGVDVTRTVGSVPVRRNYRTNIYGSLLTGNLDVNVDIEPGTGGDKDVMLTWDGETKTEPAYDATSGTYTVKGTDELAWLASQENTDYEGQTIVLESDLDLAGHDFPAFASGVVRGGASANGTSFKGVFDGNGKTIRNATVVVEGAGATHAVGFFASVAGAKAAVRNVTFTNVKIINESAEQAGIVGLVTEGATIENVKVMGSGTIKSKQAAGGIVGRVLKSGTVKDCENHADVSTTAHNVGGIVGAAYYNNEGMTISGCNNYGNISGNYGAGGIVGLNTGVVENCNNYGETVTCTTASVGGIVGEQHASGSVTGCTNYADVTGGDGGTSTYGAGGIVGWVRYDTSTTNYPNLEPITVSGCTNEGKHIKGVTGVGGIVGMWYCDGVCTQNTNLAESITASGSFVAGIVGGTQWTEVSSERTKDYGDEKLVVSLNTTYTADDKITGDCSADFIYDNTQGKHTTITDDNKKAAMTTVSDSAALKEAVSEEGAYIKLENGTYTIPTKVANGVTFEGDGNVVFEITGQHNTPSMSGSGITFKKVKMVYDNSNYHGLNDCTDLTYIDCEFEGQPFSYAKGLTYSHCTFNQTDGDSYNMWTYTATPVTFEDCTFNCAGKGLLIYNEGGATSVEVHIKNCKFYASKPAGSGKAAIEMDSSFHSIEVSIDNCTAEGFDLGSVSGNSLWNHKKGDKEVTVYVNGQKVK